MHKTLIISFFSVVAFVLFPVGSADASNIQGDVRGVDGRPLQGAEVRIERIDKTGPAMTATTNAKGYYLSKELATGAYKISVVEGGAVKSSVNVKTVGDKARVDFNLKPSAGKKVKHYVWVAPATGTNIRGRWVEADENGLPIAGGWNIQKASGELAREMTRRQGNSDR